MALHLEINALFLVKYCNLISFTFHVRFICKTDYDAIASMKWIFFYWLSDGSDAVNGLLGF